MHFLSLNYPSGSLPIRSALGLSLFERGMVSIVRGGIGHFSRRPNTEFNGDRRIENPFQNRVGPSVPHPALFHAAPAFPPGWGRFLRPFQRQRSRASLRLPQ